MSTKRNRSVNWDEEEKQLYRSVLKDYVHIIENKSLDTNTNKIKTRAWEEVHQKFNSLNSRQRELSQLKIQWKGMKVYARKSYGTYKKESNKTGGGARPATPDKAVIEIKDLLNPAELLIDNNIYDSDGIFIKASESPKVEDRLTLPTENVLPVLQEESEDVTISATPLTYTGKIRAKKNAAHVILNTSQKNALKSRKNRHDEYVDRMTSHSKVLKEIEFNRRMQMADEKHAIEIEILKETLKQAQLERKISEEKLRRLTALNFEH